MPSDSYKTILLVCQRGFRTFARRGLRTKIDDCDAATAGLECRFDNTYFEDSTCSRAIHRLVCSFIKIRQMSFFFTLATIRKICYLRLRKPRSQSLQKSATKPDFHHQFASPAQGPRKVGASKHHISATGDDSKRVNSFVRPSKGRNQRSLVECQEFGSERARLLSLSLSRRNHRVCVSTG